MNISYYLLTSYSSLDGGTNNVQRCEIRQCGAILNGYVAVFTSKHDKAVKYAEAYARKHKMKIVYIFAKSAL
jgi:hypothetical protein